MKKQTIEHYEKTKDLIDQNIDLMLNYRQSGHPGGSRSKVHAFVTLLLSGAMRWDIRHPEKRYADRFVLGAGHTVPLVYAALAVFNESLRIKYRRTGDERYNPGAAEKTLFWEDLTGFRRRGGLSGHAEMEGKTLFLKFNTGPSGHGASAAAGQAVALKRAGAGEVKVFLLEGEGGLTPGVTHEVANSAYGLALDNLCFLVDWNDYGIDSHKFSTIVYGTPYDWFSSHGWETFDAGSGEQWDSLSNTLVQMARGENPKQVPRAAWFTSRKGRGYLKYDNDSHGAPHKMNSELFWEIKREFMDKYQAEFHGFGQPASKDPDEQVKQFNANLQAVAEVLAKDTELVDFLADRLVELGDSVPESIPGSCIEQETSPFADPVLYDAASYPKELYAEPGSFQPNRAALAKWGAWINSYGRKNFDRPLVIASSADLSGSTNISGFADGFGETPGYGWYERKGSSQGVLLPQGITEFANAGIMTGIASVNFSLIPEQAFNGFWATTSTYGSFSYLLYGMLRLYSQIDQDCDLKIGKVIYIAGHSGPETADDSRTHFGIFSPGVTQLFPDGAVINLYPWEHNEVPVTLAAALKLEKPSVVILHLTRPPVEIPDRDALGMPSHLEAAKGAYIVRDYRSDAPKMGTFYVQGTSAMANAVNLLPKMDENEYNIKVVYVSSPQLFALQDEAYRNRVVTDFDRSFSTLITTSGRKLMPEFTFNELSTRYAVSADWDNRWRTGGTLDEVLEEAHLTPEWIEAGIQKFTNYVTQNT